MKIRFQFVLVFCIGCAVGFAIARLTTGEWKPTGDGFSVIHTRTGEMRRMSNGISDLSDVAGEWIMQQQTQGEPPVTLVITPRTLSVNGYRLRCNVIDRSPNEIIIQRASMKFVEGLKLINSGTIEYGKDVYKRNPALR